MNSKELCQALGGPHKLECAYVKAFLLHANDVEAINQSLN